MENKKKAFTLVELLAVIVILAIILVIAIPQIMNTIKSARVSSIKDSAILIAEQADKDFLSQQVLNPEYNATSIQCSEVAKLNDDYESCSITYNNGIAAVTLKGKDGGKFSGISCTGTKDNMVCIEGEVTVRHPSTIMAWVKDSNTDFHNSSIRNTITEIEFVDLNNVSAPSVNNTTSWDVSEAKNNSVIAWLSGTKLYIGGKDGVKGNINSSYMFHNFQNLTSINFNNNFDTSNVEKMNLIFSDSIKLNILDVSSFNTSKVTDMSLMFGGEDHKIMSLTEIKGLENFDTSKVTSMRGMFQNAVYLTKLDLSNFDTSKVTDMSYIFCGGLSNKMSLTEIKGLENFDTSKVTNMKQMFQNLTKITKLDLSSFDTSKVTDMTYMFAVDDNLQTIYVSDKWTTESVINSDKMFSGCTSLIGGNGTKYKASDINVTYAVIDTINQKGYLTNHIINNPNYIKSWTKNSNTDFHNSNIRSTITEIEFVDLNKLSAPSVNGETSWDVSEAQDESVIAWLSGAKLYIGGKDGVKGNINSSYMFHNFQNLTSINFNNNFDTSNVEKMNLIFSDSIKLNILDVSSFNTSKVTDMSFMFGGEYSTRMSLKEIKGLENFDTSSVENMRGMFQNLTKMTKLDISSFDTSKVTNTEYMFAIDDNLQTIYVSDKWTTESVTNSDKMFSGCTSLVGGNGTKISSSIDKTYAKIDNYAQKGYLTNIRQDFIENNTELQYIESEGNQYIDTLYKPNENTKVDIIMQSIDWGEYKNVFGVRTYSSNISTNRYAIWLYSDKSFYFHIGKDEQRINSQFNNSYTNTKFHLITENGKIVIKDLVNNYEVETYDFDKVGNFKTDYNLVIGALSNSNSIVNLCKYKLYSLKIYEGNNLIRDYIPVHNIILNSYGLYDKIEGKFYRNNGTDNFAGGPVKTN